VQNVEKIANGKLKVTIRPTRRRQDPKPPQRVKYATVNAAVAAVPGFSAGFLAEPDVKTNGIIDFPRSGLTSTFDTVILTCPSNVAAKMASQLSSTEKDDLENIRYQGIVCASMLTRASLSDFYVTNITDGTPFTGVIEMSALVDKKEFGRNALIYLPKYVAPDDELFDRTDKQIEESFLSALEGMYPRFKRKDVVAFKISRVRQVFPLPVLNYSRDLPSTTTSVDGLYIVNSSHIVNGTLNVNETVQLAERFFEQNFAGQKHGQN
jgi:hypothetical protein